MIIISDQRLVDEFPRQSKLGKYKRAYEYYTRSCENTNEVPVSFEIYLKLMPLDEVERMIELYNL